MQGIINNLLFTFHFATIRGVEVLSGKVPVKAWMCGGTVLDAELFRSLSAPFQRAVLTRAAAAAGLTAIVGEPRAQELVDAADRAVLNGTFDGSFPISNARVHFVAGIEGETDGLSVSDDVFHREWTYVLVLFDPDFEHASVAGWIPGDEIETLGKRVTRPVDHGNGLR